MIEKTGYVYKFKIESTRAHGADKTDRDFWTYFTVVISDQSDNPVNTEEFRLQRFHKSNIVDEDDNGDQLAVSYSNVSMAIFVTIKDAFWHKHPIKVVGTPVLAGPFPEAPDKPYNKLESVEVTG